MPTKNRTPNPRSVTSATEIAAKPFPQSASISENQWSPLFPNPTLMSPRPKPLCSLLFLLVLPLSAQEAAKVEDTPGRIVVDVRGEPAKPPVFYSARIETLATVNREATMTEAAVLITSLQGSAEKFRLGLRGSDRVVSVTGETVSAWAVRQEGENRSLDVSVKAEEGNSARRRLLMPRARSSWSMAK